MRTFYITLLILSILYQSFLVSGIIFITIFFRNILDINKEVRLIDFENPLTVSWEEVNYTNLMIERDRSIWFVLLGMGLLVLSFLVELISALLSSLLS